MDLPWNGTFAAMINAAMGGNRQQVNKGTQFFCFVVFAAGSLLEDLLWVEDLFLKEISELMLITLEAEDEGREQPLHYTE